MWLPIQETKCVDNKGNQIDTHGCEMRKLNSTALNCPDVMQDPCTSNMTSVPAIWAKYDNCMIVPK